MCSAHEDQVNATSGSVQRAKWFNAGCVPRKEGVDKGLKNPLCVMAESIKEVSEFWREIDATVGQWMNK